MEFQYNLAISLNDISRNSRIFPQINFLFADNISFKKYARNTLKLLHRNKRSVVFKPFYLYEMILPMDKIIFYDESLNDSQIRTRGANSRHG